MSVGDGHAGGAECCGESIAHFIKRNICEYVRFRADDLDVFHPDRMASRILGMGDVLSLIERAQETADEKAAEETAKRMMENKFDMNDMLDQFAQIRKMGGAGAMLSMLPGGSGIDSSQVDEKAFDAHRGHGRAFA